MAFELLSEPIRRYIRDKRWESLRPIQAAAIAKILATDDNYILASRTASGKTEAAFLPILSKVDFRAPGVQVLYVSPLIALINDQFTRVEELCKYLDVRVTKWHGEASKSAKNHLAKEPEGIVLITPESIEAMFINAPYQVKALFANLKYVVVDEIHAFLGSDRGVQLQSLLSRLGQINAQRFSVVGLSATIGDYQAAKKFTGDEANTKVLLDRTAKEMEAFFKYFPSEGAELPLALLKDLFRETQNSKALIFPNSRGMVEEVAVKLKKISERVKGHPHYFSHHSSVDKEVREYVEHFAKGNGRQPFCIACTSTLELGIDIGTVDTVVQIDAAHSVASLIQRVGRSGRRDGEMSKLLLYATNPWSLLQSLACWLLYQEGFVEPVQSNEKPYDILLHQMLSIVKESGGCRREVLLEKIGRNAAFQNIPISVAHDICQELLRQGLLELIGSELIIGVEGEAVVNGRDFYSVFTTEPFLKVMHKGDSIGQIALSPQVKEDENIYLAARIWKIMDIDLKARRVEVLPAHDGKKPIFFGSPGTIHPRVREKMLEILLNQEEGIPALDEAGAQALKELRKDFAGFVMDDSTSERPVAAKANGTIVYSFNGTRLNRSLFFLLNLTGTACTYEEHNSTFGFGVGFEQVTAALDRAKAMVDQIEVSLADALLKNPSLISFSKWGSYLPLPYQTALLKEKHFDFAGVEQFLTTIHWVSNPK